MEKGTEEEDEEGEETEEEATEEGEEVEAEWEGPEVTMNITLLASRRSLHQEASHKPQLPEHLA